MDWVTTRTNSLRVRVCHTQRFVVLSINTDTSTDMSGLLRIGRHLQHSNVHHQNRHPPPIPTRLRRANDTDYHVLRNHLNDLLDNHHRIHQHIYLRSCFQILDPRSTRTMSRLVGDMVYDGRVQPGH